jgi:hypothetical protein
VKTRTELTQDNVDRHPPFTERRASALQDVSERTNIAQVPETGLQLVASSKALTVQVREDIQPAISYLEVAV